MSNLRSMIVKLRGAVGLHSPRRLARLPVSISLAVKASSGRPHHASESYTCDLSSTGLSFMLSSTCVGDRHIFSDGGVVLRVMLELPGGPVELDALPVRYDLMSEREHHLGYLVGARIVAMRDDDRNRYGEFLHSPISHPATASQIRTPKSAAAVS